ncbi:hypothetical protein [Mesorhizobium sp.]|uniref:hypothetical protein n=1 Tax=Mesorhizobium sp. TaxID=1871066 RepID=UPI0025BE1619|nr:hypothetical protein [Mesorhizobium sp.]
MTMFPLGFAASSMFETGRVEQGDLPAVDVEANRVRVVVDGDARRLKSLRRGRLGNFRGKASVGRVGKEQRQCDASRGEYNEVSLEESVEVM